MKKILALALGFVLLMSCSSDDSGNSTIDTSLLTDKKWYAVSRFALGQTVPYENENPECGRDYAEFKTGGIFQDGYFTDCTLYIRQGNWSINGNQITITNSNEENEEESTVVITITRLTNSELEVVSTYDFNDDGVEENVVLKMSSN